MKMSRSYRHTPKCSWSRHDSEKADKKLWHRRMRTAIRARLHNANPDEVLLPLDNEIGNVWCFYKDGKFRFDPREHPKWMRK
jgi:hypothetical protein